MNSSSNTNWSFSGSNPATGTTTQSSTSVSDSFSTQAFAQSSTTQSTQSSFVGSSLTQQGTYAGGNYAFSSMTYRYQSSGAFNYQETDNGSFTGSEIDGYQQTSDRSITSADGSYSGMSSSTKGEDQIASWGSNSTTASDVQSTTYSLYESGAGVGGTYNLSCVSQYESTTERSFVQTTGTSNQSGTDSSTVSMTTTGGDGNGHSSGQDTFQSGSDSYTQTSATSSDETSQTTSISRQQGSYAAGSYSYSSVVYQDVEQNDVESFSGLTQSYTRTSASAASQNSVYPGSTSQGNSQSSTRSGQDSTQITELSNGDSHYYAAGSYSGASGDFSLSSVNYLSDAQATSSFSQTGSYTETGTISSNQSKSSLLTSMQAGMSMMNQSESDSSQSSSETYVTTGSEATQQYGSAAAEIVEQGTYGGGSYAFSNIGYEDSTSASTMTADASTSDATQTFNTTSGSSSSWWAFNAQGIPIRNKKGSG